MRVEARLEGCWRDGVKNWAELVAFGRANPGKLTFGSIAVGST